MKNIAKTLFPQIRGHYESGYDPALHIGDAAELLRVDLTSEASKERILPHSWVVTGSEAQLRSRSDFRAISLRGLHEMLLLSSTLIAKEYRDELAQSAEALLGQHL